MAALPGFPANWAPPSHIVRNTEAAAPALIDSVRPQEVVLVVVEESLGSVEPLAVGELRLERLPEALWPVSLPDDGGCPEPDAAPVEDPGPEEPEDEFWPDSVPVEEP